MRKDIFENVKELQKEGKQISVSKPGPKSRPADMKLRMTRKPRSVWSPQKSTAALVQQQERLFL